MHNLQSFNFKRYTHLEQDEDQLDEIEGDVKSFGQESKMDEVWHVNLHHGHLSENYLFRP